MLHPFTLSRLVRIAPAVAVALLAAACNVDGAVAPGASLPERSEPAQPAAPATASPATPALGATLYAAPDSPARRQADLWRGARTADAALMTRIAEQPFAKWLAEWTPDVAGAVRGTLAAAAAQGGTAVFVAYNIPHRDCGLYSAGGVRSADAYRAWIRQIAAGLDGRRAAVILEPDAAPAAGCLGAALQDERFALLRDAVQVLSAAGALVYVDGGNARWMGAAQVAALLERAGVAGAQGFALNVSNFVGTEESAAFADAVGQRLGGKRYVIDTSRNGLGPAAGAEWCNPAGRAIGDLPTTRTGRVLADAFLWVKVPGESDGTCNGGPAAGHWWGEYALGLAQRSTSLR